jgi:hypothetical protein
MFIYSKEELGKWGLFTCLYWTFGSASVPAKASVPIWSFLLNDTSLYLARDHSQINSLRHYPQSERADCSSIPHK